MSDFYWSVLVVRFTKLSKSCLLIVIIALLLIINMVQNKNLIYSGCALKFEEEVAPKLRQRHLNLYRRRYEKEWRLILNGIPKWILKILERLPEEERSQILSLNLNRETTGDWKQEERCALCFFGLTRAYRNLVLPSIVQNILVPNARHNCDIFVHYYNQTEEASGRMNSGGTINPGDILLLANATRAVSQLYHHHHHYGNDHRIPHVSFAVDTDAQFKEKRAIELAHFQNTLDANGTQVYFPWKKGSWSKRNLDNVVRQWHSIESAFNLMVAESEANTNNNMKYSRVGMFRSDCMYLTPIDIAMVSGSGKSGNNANGNNNIVDSNNQNMVIPAFAQYPVNDRMIYGPFQGVKIWATKRFKLIETRAKNKTYVGRVMHSEAFMLSHIFPAILKWQGGAIKNIVKNPDICFIRTRADESVMIGDCVNPKKFIVTNTSIETIVEKSCTLTNIRRKVLGVNC